MKMIAAALLVALGLSGCIAVPVYEPGYRPYGYYGGGYAYRPYGHYGYRSRYP